VAVGDDRLARGREAGARGAWADAYEALSAVDESDGLGGEDLELLATASYMLGHADEYFGALERGHQAHVDAGEGLRAARCAIWIGMNLAREGEMGHAQGWLGRARRLVDREPEDCAELGYLRLPDAFEREAAGDWEGAVAILADAAAVGERFGDLDLIALARHEQGHVLIINGRANTGLELLDETMVAAATAELSPIVTGIVYCGVILACQEAYEPRRAQEWTAALTEWCQRQPDMVAFTGRCLVHRAEIMQMHGTWPDALEEARRAAGRCAEGNNELAAAEAIYRQAEIHRLRGDFEAAETAYLDAGRRGREPQPGLALLRLAQGNGDAALAAIRRAATETTEPAKRAGLLPAYVEILLAAGDLGTARGACAELEAIGAEFEAGAVGAMAGQATGATRLAAGDAEAALVALRESARIWQKLEAPYEAARARTLVGLACRSLGDDDTAAIELEAARDAFAELGAQPDLTRAEGLLRQPHQAADTHGLTTRELEVLRLVAAGETNRAIAAELVLSERTVDRHVSNIFAKLGVSSRTAATAFAYEHELI
jgi:DNA-binding CsgD family transcriptional regulator